VLRVDLVPAVGQDDAGAGPGELGDQVAAQKSGGPEDGCGEAGVLREREGEREGEDREDERNEEGARLGEGVPSRRSVFFFSLSRASSPLFTTHG
jgi:hypothetical protein